MTSNGSEESRSRSNMSPDMDLEKDNRPEHSPYASETCAVAFRDGEKLYIPREYLNQVEQISRYLVRGGTRPGARFNHITSATGHVLLHFLVCGVYQCLRPEGDTLEKRRTSEFKTALDVYLAADSLHLPRLRDLARREIARVGDTLSLPSIMSAFEDSDMSSNMPLGVNAYLESRILSFGEEATPAVIDSMLSELEGPNTLSRILLRSIVRLKSSELLKQQQKLHNNEGEVYLWTSQNVLEGMMKRRRSTPEQAMKEAEAKAETLSEVAESLSLAEKASFGEPKAFPAEEAPAECDPTAEADCGMHSLLTKEEIKALHSYKQSKRGGEPRAFPAEEPPAKCIPAAEAGSEKQSLLTKEEIKALHYRQSQRGSRQLKRDRAHLELCIERALIQDDLKAPKVINVASIEEATAAPFSMTPAMEERPTLDLPGSLNTKGDQWETASFDRPGSRGSETWSFAGTPASHSSQTSPKLDVSKDHAEVTEDVVCDWDAIFKRSRERNQGWPSWVNPMGSVKDL
ncbi:hypothetical protein NCS52_00796400 [Fusarium sp. LHS14.1]|nr:hypothetical protein NCS52_00796400 [Fusarium sp. LHS14.1]